MKFIQLFFLISLSSSLGCLAQSAGSTQQQSSNSRERFLPTEQRAPQKKNKKKKTSGPTVESLDEYEDRMARLVKEKRKAEKEMLKPQYSNPMYFGHKRPPKKRKAGKMKFCKECGIRH